MALSSLFGIIPVAAVSALFFFLPAKVSGIDYPVRDDKMIEKAHSSFAKITGSRVTVWYAPEDLPKQKAADLADLADKGIVLIEKSLFMTMDKSHYKTDHIEIIVENPVVSHVYGGYDHPRYDKPVVFLKNAQAASRTTPVLHEMTHIIAWKFSSHSLREGLANYMQLTNAPLAGYPAYPPRKMADNMASKALESEYGESLFATLGKDGVDSLTLPTDPKSRPQFYAVSQSFTQYLIEKKGLAVFMKIYSAPSAEKACRKLTGKDLDEWKEEWRKQLKNR
jgi:hypothetical protein